MRFVIFAAAAILSGQSIAGDCERLFEDESTRAKCNVVRDTSFYWNDEKLRAAVASVIATEAQCRRLYTGEALGFCLEEAARISSPIADEYLDGPVKRMVAGADLKRRRQAAQEKLAAVSKSAAFRLKGLYPGMTLDEAETLHPGFKQRCVTLDEKTAEFSCSLDSGRNDILDNSVFTTLADRRVQIWMADGSQSKIWNISILVDSDDADEIGDQLARKYAGSVVTGATVSNRMGAKFQNKERTWRRGDMVLQVERYSVDLKTGTVRFFSLKQPIKPKKPVGKDL